MGDSQQSLVPVEQAAEQPKDALAQVAQNLSALKPKEDSLLTISSKSLGDVLPAKFYEGASQLTLSDTEKALLAELQNATDDEVEIRPDGLIYVEHITVRRALSKVFGTEWACIPGSAIAQDKLEKSTMVAQRWVLVVRGCYVGEAIGAGNYFPENPQQNKTDAAESAQSEAIRRICAKSALGICSNVFQKSFQRAWRREYAIQVWVKGYNGNKKLWRRKDADPFDEEIGPVDSAKQSGKDKYSRSASERPPQEDVVLPQTEVPRAEFVKPPLESKSTNNIPSPKIDKSPEYPTTQQSESEPMVTDGNWRLFIMECRKRGLVAGDVAQGAMAILVDKAGIAMPAQTTGRKQIESLNAMFKTMNATKFSEVIAEVRKLPAKG